MTTPPLPLAPPVHPGQVWTLTCLKDPLVQRTAVVQADYAYFRGPGMGDRLIQLAALEAIFQAWRTLERDHPGVWGITVEEPT